MIDPFQFHAQTRVIPVVVINDESDAAPLAEALKAAGLPSAEVTLRTPAALAALRIMAEDPEFMVGAGTVTRPEQVELAAFAGARYIVSPGFSADVVRSCQIGGLPVLPGIATATELQQATIWGLGHVKFFPAAAAGGVAMIKALSAPFPDVRFVPTGGVSLDSMADYLAVPSVLAIGGSWMVSQDLIARREFGRITELAAEAVELATR
ncbi:MAG: bifunctional 4-hydroxy-2-oxoglutarate aldolase/2-dehydro-3-deoxy-phosphogluconate aldolase [bacterium]|nr:bifunctional 4-hydroxy-2-oxoglutarate aldolase/2-dehydro-3-deoxy-phosphogluconate aldolase [bacterium]